MRDFALEQAGHARQANMRVWTHIQPRASVKRGWTELIEQYERSDHARLGAR